MTQVLALTAAALYGVADFAGGLATRSLSAWRVTIWSQVFGLPLLGVAIIIIGFSEVTTTDIALGALAGGFGLVGLVLLYSALAAGSMSIVAPIVGVLAASIPVAWDLADGGVISAIQWIGIALAIVAVLLLVSHRSASSMTVLILAQALGAAISFSVFVIAMSQTSESSGLWPLLPARIISIPIGFAVLAITSTAVLPARPLLRLVAFVGIIDIAASSAIVLAVQRGPLGINAVISSLYPAFTVLAALVVLKERPATSQAIGIGLAILAVLLLAL
ncbi:MAG: DMT family transporter [Actinomycetia bacterium]|nr:DMT family transporter [Actinomycetes bacterium]